MNKHNGNGLYIEIIAQAIEGMKELQVESFSLENVNFAEYLLHNIITKKFADNNGEFCISVLEKVADCPAGLPDAT